jgi:geranylgeranyl diphosphate synthase type II
MRLMIWCLLDGVGVGGPLKTLRMALLCSVALPLSLTASCPEPLARWNQWRVELQGRLSLSRRPEADSASLQLSRAMDYASVNGGKRLRALLLLAAGEDKGLSLEGLWPLAMAIERLHSASLIIDDLPAQDNASQRRSQPTLHKRFDESTAQLAAISLLMEGLDLRDLQSHFSAERLLHLSSFWAKSIGQQGMSLGQFMDLHPAVMNGDPKIFEQAYYFKTGVGFEASLAPAFILSGADLAILDFLKTFSFKLGVVFQLNDDLLDLNASSEQTGKDVQADSKNGRPNLASILGEKNARELIAKYQEELFEMTPKLFGKNSKTAELIVILVGDKRP